MAFVLRVLVMLAVVTPLFVATEFHAPWWQILVAACVGSALGHLAVRLTRDRTKTLWVAIVAAALVIGAAGAWSLTHKAPKVETVPFTLVVKGNAGYSDRSSLTWADVEAIKTEVSGIRIAAPYLRAKAQVAAEEANWNTEVIGATEDYFRIWSMHASAGELYEGSPGPDKKVAVLGSTVATQLFGPNHNAVGETIRIDQRPYTVVGVLASRGIASSGQDLDDTLIIPALVFTAKLGGGRDFHGRMLIDPESRGDTARIETELRSVLRDRHRLAPGAEDDFEIYVVPETRLP